jgi:hypothetical protein
MTTLKDLPTSDPVIIRLLGSLWIGDVKIKPDTVLDKHMIRDKIKMFETADMCNSWEAASVSQAIKDLEQLLTYL